MDDDTAKALMVLFLLVFVFALVVIGPFFTVWSLNWLFGTEIVMSFKTWCAVIWLMTVLRGVNMAVKKSE